MVETIAVIIIIAVVTSAALPKMATSSSAATLSAARAQGAEISTVYAALVAKQSAATPASPFPSLTRIASERLGDRAPLALDYSGLCVSDRYKLSTYSDALMSAPTASPGDIVKNLAAEVAPDSVNCPPSPRE